MDGFRPTDEAFAKLKLGASSISSAFSKANLTDILFCNALEREGFSDKTATLVGDVPMVNGRLSGLMAFDCNLVRQMLRGTSHR